MFSQKHQSWLHYLAQRIIVQLACQQIQNKITIWNILSYHLKQLLQYFCISCHSTILSYSLPALAHHFGIAAIHLSPRHRMVLIFSFAVRPAIPCPSMFTSTAPLTGDSGSRRHQSPLCQHTPNLVSTDIFTKDQHVTLYQLLSRESVGCYSHDIQKSLFT